MVIKTTNKTDNAVHSLPVKAEYTAMVRILRNLGMLSIPRITVYSPVPDKDACMFINLDTFFQPACSY